MPSPWLTFFSFVWSTGIHGKKKPTDQFRCKRSNSILWLSHCRPGFREMAESSWHGSAKCGCWFWWCGIKQPNIMGFCVQGVERGMALWYRVCLINGLNYPLVLLPKSKTITCGIWSYSNTLLAPYWMGATILCGHYIAKVACVAHAFCSGLNSSLASLSQHVFGEI